MIKRLEEIERKYNDLSLELTKPEVLADSAKYVGYAKAYSDLEEIVSVFGEYKKSHRNWMILKKC